MNILFICKHNRFRSKVAEAIFNKLNKNKKIRVESAGTVMDKLRPYIEQIVISILNEKGYIAKGKPRQLTGKIAEDADLVVIVADNVERQLLGSYHNFSGKIIKWDVKDCSALDEKRIRKSIEQIEGKVKQFVQEISE